MAGSGDTTSAPISVLRISLRRPKPDSLLPRAKTSTALVAGRVAAAGRVAQLDELVPVHERLRPVHGAEADAEQGERDAEAEERCC